MIAMMEWLHFAGKSWSRRSHDAPRRPRMVPRRPQNAPQPLPRLLKMLQDATKTAPKRPRFQNVPNSVPEAFGRRVGVR